MKLGTAISYIATPVAGALGLDCYDQITRDLKPESPCAKARASLDIAKTPQEFATAIFDRLRSNKPKGDQMSEETETQYYTIVLQVEALDAVEALQKKDSGKVLAVTPQQQKPRLAPTQGLAPRT
jgi:hypothetical protein